MSAVRPWQNLDKWVQDVVLGGLVIFSSTLIGCASPSDTRVISPDSKAVVGPLVSVDDADTPAPHPEGDTSSSTTAPETNPEQNKTATNETSNAKNVDTESRQPDVAPPKAPSKTLATDQPRAINKSDATSEPKATPTIEKVKSKTTVPKITQAKLGGEITLLGSDGETIRPDNIIVSLHPNFPLALKATNTGREPTRHIVDMENKFYNPGQLLVTTRDSITFVNKDPIKHNVFSSSGENAFDLGTYAAGKSREVTLFKEGIVKVYCNIHAQMATFVNVNDYGLSALTDTTGKFVIENIPPGDYRVKVWHIRGETSKNIAITPDDSNIIKVTLDTRDFNNSGHKNKFGREYKDNSNIFKDEFY